MFKKILIANRGEIAVRIIRACREMGIVPAAVFSEADRRSPHVLLADEAVCLGPAPASESYLHVDRIVQAVRRTGAEAVHPGYGFLSENASFARRLEAEGIVFIGPRADALELVGDKVRARQTMEKAGIPIIPGMKTVATDPAEYRAAARSLGFPVIVKASAGGGGKGMRIVRQDTDLEAAIEAGRREAKSAFGDESVYLEKCLEAPRHVEIQVLADNAGRTVHLFERECSLQRRHQKIVEESPSPALDPKLRARMGETAVRAMRAANYNNAGTVEFLLDKDRNFYFLEVNARLQVEHPVTELVTGVDLVRRQIRIAAGEALGLSQVDLKQNGHALECRIYAEDPAAGFLPSPGKILLLREPRGPGVRVDSGIYGGWDVPLYYDPILAKLIVWAEDREAACRRMGAALDGFVVLGIRTTIDFLKDVIGHPDFRAGRTDTGFIPARFENWQPPRTDDETASIAAAAVAIEEMTGGGTAPAGIHPAGGRKEAPAGPWRTLGPWRIGSGT
jgi:acetyl-CoA carboxylase biotin carboxylase subunit